MNHSVSLSLLIVSLGTPVVSAQEITNVVTTEVDAASAKVEEKKAESKEGVESKLAVGSNFLFNYTDNVVGVPANGSTLQANVLVDGTLNLRKGQHQLFNEGKLVLGTSRTPLVPVFVKSADNLELRSTYLFSMKKVPWLGPFARASLNTSLFPSFLIDDEVVTQVLDEEGEVVEEIRSAPIPATGTDASGNPTTLDWSPDEEGSTYRLPLTSSLEPLLLRQVGGMLARPIDKGTKAALVLQLGVGFEELIAKGGYTVTRLEYAGGQISALEVKQLSTYVNAGGQIEANANGAFNEYVNWTVAALLFTPVFTTLEDSRTNVELTSIDANAKVSVKLSKWASLDYVFGARRTPQLFGPGDNYWQIQTGVLLSTTFNVVDEGGKAP